MTSIGLRYETSVVRVTSPDPTDLSWLATFLACGFELVDPTSADDDVELVVDPIAHDVVLERGRTATGTDLECFANDAKPSTVEPWSREADALVVRVPRLPGFYRWWPSRRRVEILARERTKRCRTVLMRVVRELTMDRVLSTGGALIHGAAVRWNDGVVAMSGPKRHGKTTLLLSLLQSTDAAYVCNDRCVLRAGPDGAFLRGLATIVSIPRTGLEVFPELCAHLFSAHPELCVADKADVSLGPYELLDLLSSPHAGSGRCAAFLFPRVTTNRERLVWRRLSATEALENLREGLFRAAQPTVLGQLFVSDANRGRAPWETAAPAARWVAEHVPCFVLELGGGAPPNADECRQLLAHVAGS